MRIKKVYLIAGLITMVLFLISTGPLLAGGGFEPPPGATILEPEIWGTVVFYCSGGTKLVTVRVKRVVNCNVETEALVDPLWVLDCPANAAALEGQSLTTGTTFFGLPGTAFINKVKNFNDQGTTISCDAQFKFYQ